MTIKTLSQFTMDSKATGRVVFISEKLYKSSMQKELISAILNQMKPLNLTPGKMDYLRTVKNDQPLVHFFALIPDDFNYDQLEELSSDILKAVKAQKLKQVDVVLMDGVLAPLTEALYKQFALASDSFDKYKTTGIAPLTGKEKPEPKQAACKFTFFIPDTGMTLKAEKEKLARASAMADGIKLARRLVNEPANRMTPEILSQEATKTAQAMGFDIEVYDEKQIQKMGLKAFWQVARGSDTPPRFMVMRYMNNPKSKKVLALVGKGLTYDSGGYALKPAPSMLTMYCDMGGAGAVIGAMHTLAALKAPVNVVAIVAACENMLSGHAYRNGDIIESLAGKYIEVVNTDAEGRLTLADAIAYAATVVKADQIIDIATLTGAVNIALGDEITGVVSDNEDIWQAISAASEASGDKVWRMPHFDCLAKQNKSERADIKNSGGRPAGTATAGLFCRAFAFGKPWGHLDIASTAYQEKGSAKSPAGATGTGVELLTRAAIRLFEK